MNTPDPAPPAAAAPPLPHLDVFIAVHGMGDQTHKESVRDVARLLSRSLVYDSTTTDELRPLAPQPLGYFTTEFEDYRKLEGPGIACKADRDEFAKGKYADARFAEIYWADLPRHAVEDKHTLQEVKGWAQTVVARTERLFKRAKPDIEARAYNYKKAAAVKKALAKPADKKAVAREAAEERATMDDATVPPDFDLAAEVLDEVIETVETLENLTFLLDKAGIFTFDLKEILEDYLGDVQQVADYQNVRLDIIGRFHTKMQGIHTRLQDKEKGREIRYHIIAHSEGTAVSFIAMLYALRGMVVRPFDESGKKRPAEKIQGPLDEVHDPDCDKDLAWIKDVRSYMTFGSPIDKHLLLWRHLWQHFLPDAASGKPQSWLNANPASPIRWRNYYDYGDPVGFKLDTARLFLEEVKCSAFEFEERHDIGFARYLMPGKAHIDYWQDQELFDHFIRNAVVNEVPPKPRGSSSLPAVPATSEELEQHAEEEKLNPGDRFGVGFWSCTIPYGLSALLLFIGCLVLYKNVSAFNHPATDTLHAWVRFQGLGTEPPRPSSGMTLILNVLGVTSLLAGVTLCSRLPRLLRRGRLKGIGWFRHGVAWLSLFVGCAGYLAFVSRQSALEIGSGLTHWLPEGWRADHAMPWQSAALDCYPGWWTLETTLVFFLSMLTCIGARVLRIPKAQCERHKHLWSFIHQGMMPLIFTGTICVALTVGLQIAAKHSGAHELPVLGKSVIDQIDKLKGSTATADNCQAKHLGTKAEELKITFQQALFRKDITNDLLETFAKDDQSGGKNAPQKLEALGHSINLAHDDSPLWPVFLALAVFFYLWRLAALLFDLTFVWHYYIRNSKSNESLLRWRKVVTWADPTLASKAAG